MCLLKFSVCLRISYLREFAWSNRLFVGTFIRRLLYRICIGIQIQFLFYHRTEKKTHTPTEQKKDRVRPRSQCSVVSFTFHRSVANSLLRRMHRPIATLMFHFSNVRMHFKITLNFFHFFHLVAYELVPNVSLSMMCIIELQTMESLSTSLHYF